MGRQSPKKRGGLTRRAGTPPQECSAICNLFLARRSRAACSPRSAEEGRSIPEEGYRLPSSSGYREKRFGPVPIFLRPVVLGAAVLGLREAPLGIGELLVEHAGVEILGWDRLLEQEPGAVAVDLQPAVGLRVAPGLRLGEMEAELGRPQRREDRRVVGQNADFADLGAGRNLPRFTAPDLALRGQDLDVDHVLRRHLRALRSRAGLG